MFKRFSKPAALAAMAAAVVSTPVMAAVNTIPTVKVWLGDNSNNVVTVPLETDYIPNVVKTENGAASTEALKAQAVAARSYMYYKIFEQNRQSDPYMRDTTAEQKYTNANPLLQRHRDAASDTWGEIILTTTLSTGLPIATFYSAGATPDSDPNTATHFPNGAPFGKGESTDGGNQASEGNITYNRGLTASSSPAKTKSPQGSQFSAQNLGSMSQNGGNFLSNNGWNYLDILRYYYGADARVAVSLKGAGSGSLPPVKPIANFEKDQGYFANGFSSQRNSNLTGRTITAIDSVANPGDASNVQSGTKAQRIFVDKVETAPPSFSTTSRGWAPSRCSRSTAPRPASAPSATQPATSPWSRRGRSPTG